MALNRIVTDLSQLTGEISTDRVEGLAETLAETEATVTAAAATAEAASAEATAAAAAVAAKADDAAVVKLTGSQTVAGPKTFADSLTVDLPLATRNAMVFTGHNSTNPLVFTYSGTDFGDGVIDNVMAVKWDRIAGVQPGWSENRESRFVGGAPPLGLLEWHTNLESIQGTEDTPDVAYRPSVMYIDLNTNLQYREHRVGVAKWFGGWQGSIPLLDLDTGGGDGGRVRIENEGANSPLEVVGTAGNVDIQLNSGQNLRLATVQTADVSNPTRNGVGLTMNGAYWTGSASAGAAASIQTVVTGNNAFHSLWSVGTSDFAWKNDGKLGLNVPLAKLTQNLVIRAGYVAAIDDFDNGPYRIIGLDGQTGRVIVDADGRGTVFANPIHFGAYGAGTGPRIRGGAPGNDNYVAIDAGAAGTSTNIVYLNLFSPNARIDAYGQANVYADGSAGKCLAVGTGSPTGILFAGNGVAHYGIRCTASTGLFELMAAPGNDPRAWTASTASLAVPGTLSSGKKLTTPGRDGPITANPDAATVTLNLGTSDFHTVTLGGNRTLAITGASTGQRFTVKLIQSGAGGWNPTWWTGITWFTSDGLKPTPAAASGKATYVQFIVTGSGAYDGFLVAAQA